MSAPPASSGMDGTICKECNKSIKDHTPEQFVECQKKQDIKNNPEEFGK